MKNSNKKSFLQKGSVAKRLALMTLFGVGFVLPSIDNMALANYGEYYIGVKANGAASGYEVLRGCNTGGTTQVLKFSDISGMGASNNNYWAKNKTTTYGGNYVVLKGTDGYNRTFKVMAYSSSNSTSGTVTLWSYAKDTGVQFTNTSFGIGVSYNTSKLRQWMTGAVKDVLNKYTGAMVAYTASGAAAGESVNGTAANNDLIWAASSSEVKNSGMWGLSSDIQRAEDTSAWLRTYDTGEVASCAFYVFTAGELRGAGLVNLSASVRPALQLKIVSRNPSAFTSNVANITETTMTAGSSGSYEYEVDSSKTATLTPTNGVTLDNLSITVSAGNGGLGSVGGLLTTNTGAAWNDISGNISHMATGTTFSLTDVDGTNRVLRIFGVDTTNKKVTNLAANKITNLSKQSSKIQMEIGGVNDGVGITLKNGAIVKLAANASNTITVSDGGGTLNLNSKTYSGTLTISSGITLDVTAGTISTAIAGAGTMKLTGNVTHSGGDIASVVNTNGKTFTISGGSLSNTVNGTGTLAITTDLSANASHIAANTNTVASGKTLTLTAGTLGKTVSGAGVVVINGAISANAGYFSQTGGLSVASGKTLTLTAGTLSKDVTNSGTVKTDGDVTISSQLTGGMLDVTSGLTKYTNANAIGATTIIRDGAKLDPAANLLNADTTVESGGELYISTGTLGVDIQGTGTTCIKDLDNLSTAQTITVNSDRSIAGTLNGSGNTVAMTGDTALKTFTIGTLTGTTNLKIDVDMSNFTADKLAVGTITGATVNLTDINVTKDIVLTFGGTLELPKEEDNKITYVSDSAGTGAVSAGGTYKINDSATGSIERQSVVTNNYIYTFTKGTTDGTLKYKAEATDLTFKKFVEGTLGDGSADPATLSLTADLANTGTGSDAITMGTSQSNTVITVNLNGYNLTSSINPTTITISSGKTFNLNGGSAIGAGTTDDKTNFSVAGVLAISGKTKVAGTISGAGIVTNSGELTIEDASKIQAAGTNGLENTGTINLGGATDSTLGGKISGGNITIAGAVTANASYLAGETTVKNGKTLTLSGGTVSGNIGIESSGTGALTIAGTVVNTNSKIIGVKTLTITSGSLTTEAGKLTVTDDISNTGTLILMDTISTALNNNLTGTGTLQIGDGSAASKITSAKTIANAVDVKANAEFTNSGNISGNVTNAGTLTSSVENLTGTITNNGTFNASGNLNKDIGGSGTTKINTSLTANDSTARTIAGTLDLNGGTLDMQGSNTVNSITVGTLSGTGNIKFDAIINGSATPTMDSIAVSNVAAGTTLTLNAVNLTGTSTAEQWGLGEANKKTVSLVTGTGLSNLTIAGTVIATSDSYRYEFSQDAAGSGVVKIVKGYAGNLVDIVQNNEVGGYQMGQIANYSLVADYTETSDLGTLTRVAPDTPRDFTVNGNNHKFDGGSKQGIAVNSGDTLTLTNISEISGWNNYAVDNAGTVNIGTAGTTVLKSELKGAGTYNLTGGTLKVETLTNLGMTTLNNAGTVELGNDTEQTLNTVINGGNITVAGELTADASKLAGATTIKDGKTLTLTGGDIVGNISKDTVAPATGTGVLVINPGAVTNTTGKNVDVAALTIDTGSLTTDANKLAVGSDSITLANNGKLILTGANDTLEEKVTGTGTLQIGDGVGTADTKITATDVITVAVEVKGDGTLVTNASNLQGAVANGGTITLNGTGTLTQDITTGTVNIGDGAGTADVITANAQLGPVTINTDGTLITNANNLTGAVTNGGNLTLTGGKLDKAVAGAGAVNTTGALEVGAAGVMSIDVDCVGGDITADKNAQITLTTNGADEDWKTGDPDHTDKLQYTINGGKITITGDLTDDGTHLMDTAGNGELTVADGKTLTITGTNVGRDITGATGTTKFVNTTDIINITHGIANELIFAPGTHSVVEDAGVLTGTVTNGGTMDVNGGTLAVGVSGDGTTVIGEDKKVNIVAGTDFTGNQNLVVKGTADVSSDGVYDSVEVGGNLSGNGTYSFDISLAGVAANTVVPTAQHDQFVVDGNAGGNIKLETIRLAGTSTCTMDMDTTAYFQLIKANGTNNITVSNRKIVTSDKSKYTFENAVAGGTIPPEITSVSGWVQVTRSTGYSLAEIVAGSKGADTEPATIPGFTLIDNLNLNDVTTNHFDNNGTIQDDFGTLKDNRTLTIDGEGFSLHGDDTNPTPQKNGVIVAEGSTLNLDNITEIANFKDYAVKNDGTVQMNGGVSGSPATPTETVLKSAITDTNGDGSKGTLILDNNAIVKVTEEPGKIAQKEIVVKAGSTLVYNGDNVTTETITNNGDVEITGGTMNSEIIGNGTNKTTGEIAVGEKGVVTFDPDLIGGNIANSGVITLKPNGADEDWKTGDPDHTDRLQYTITGGKVVIDGEMRDSGEHIGSNEVEITEGPLVIESNEFIPGVINGPGALVFETDNPITLEDKKINTEVEFRGKDGTPGGDVTISGEIYGPINNNGGTTTMNGGILGAEINTGDTGKVIFAGDTEIYTQQSKVSDFEQKANVNVTVPLSLLGGENGGIFTNLTKLPTIDDSAKLTITGCEGLVENQIYTLVRGDADAITGTEILWKNIVVIGDGEVEYDLVYATSAEGGEVAIPGVITLKAIDNGGRMKEDPRFDDPSMLDRFKAMGGEQAEFVQKVKNLYRSGEEQKAMDAVNSITNFSSVAEINTSMAIVSAAVTDNIMDHVSMGSKPVIQREGYKIKNTATPATETMTPDYVEIGKADNLMPERLNKAVYDKEVWASYVHGKDNMDGMKAGSLSKSSTNQYNGTTVGVDLWSGAKSFGGMSLSYVDGTVNNSNSAANTRNKVKNYGVNFYHRQDTGNDSALLFNVGYIQAKNDISMNNLGYNITAEPKVESYNAGVRFEKEFKTGRSRVIPYAGVNYSFVKTGEYSNSWGERYQVDNQHLINVPVGLKWTGEFKMPNSVWTWRPRVEAGYNFNHGGRGNKQTILNSFKTTEFDTFDCGTYYVRAGMDFVYKNFTGGFGYNFSKSNHIRNNRWNVDVSWKF